MHRMVERLERLWAWLHTHEGKKLFRYTMISVISTSVSFMVLLIVYGVLRLWSEVPSTVFANAMASIPSYWLTRNWAWGKRGRSSWTREALPFWVMSGLGICVSIVGASLAAHVGKVHHLTHHEQTALVLLANLLSFSVFWVLKLMVFNRVFHVKPLLDEIDEEISVEEQSEGAGFR